LLPRTSASSHAEKHYMNLRSDRNGQKLTPFVIDLLADSGKLDWCTIGVAIQDEVLARGHWDVLRDHFRLQRARSEQLSLRLLTTMIHFVFSTTRVRMKATKQ
jgi:hypothetical protein